MKYNILYKLYLIYLNNHNPFFTKSCEHLGRGNQIDILCFARLSLIDKVRKWLGIIENYFEYKGISVIKQKQMDIPKLIEKVFCQPASSYL